MDMRLGRCIDGRGHINSADFRARFRGAAAGRRFRDTTVAAHEMRRPRWPQADCPCPAWQVRGAARSRQRQRPPTASLLAEGIPDTPDGVPLPETVGALPTVRAEQAACVGDGGVGSRAVATLLGRQRPTGIPCRLGGGFAA